MKMSFLARALLAATLALSAVPGFAAGPADLMAAADDDALAEALVRRRLSQDDLAPYHRLEVVVRDGVATLTGSVRTKSTLDAVVTEVGKVAGVDRVDDRVKVEPNP
jgi:osmotically-inducible protein OsmY